MNICFHRNPNVIDWTDCNKFFQPSFSPFYSAVSDMEINTDLWAFTSAICQPSDRKHILTSHLFLSDQYYMTPAIREPLIHQDKGENGNLFFFPTWYCHSSISWM